MNEDISILAAMATKEAYNEAVKGENGAVVRQGDDMVRIDRNGTVSVLKTLPPLIAVKGGSRYTINDLEENNV